MNKRLDKSIKSSCLKELFLALLPFYPETFSYEEIEIILTKANGVIPNYEITKVWGLKANN